MSDIPFEDQRSLLFYGAIQRATANGANTAEIWSAIKEQATNLGLDKPGISIRDVSRMRSAAGSWVRAANGFAGADSLSPVRGEYVALAPWARDLNERNTFSQYLVSFQHTFEVNGVEQTEYRSVKFNNLSQYTVGSLMDAVENDAQQMADNYGTIHVGISDVSITEI